MKWKGLILLTVLAFTGSAVLAGGDYKCNEPTQNCLDMMAAHLQKTGWVGIELDHDEETGDLTIKRVIADSPAQASGLKAGDVLVAMNGIEVNDANEAKLKAAKKELAPGKEVVYTVSRNGKSKDIDITLAEVPSDVLAQWIGNHMLEHAQIAQN